MEGKQSLSHSVSFPFCNPGEITLNISVLLLLFFTCSAGRVDDLLTIHHSLANPLDSNMFRKFSRDTHILEVSE